MISSIFSGACAHGIHSHFSCVQLFVTSWTVVAHQAPLSMGFSRQEYWSGLPFPSPGDLPDPGIELMSPGSPTLQVGFFTTEPLGKSFSCAYWPFIYLIWSNVCSESLPKFLLIYFSFYCLLIWTLVKIMDSIYKSLIRFIICKYFLHSVSFFPFLKVSFEAQEILIW